MVQTIWRGITTQFDSLPHSDVESKRDCLAAPGNMIDATSSISAGSVLNKNKTCYKCQQEGHVRFYISTLSSDYSDSPRLREIAQRILNLLAELITHSPCHEIDLADLDNDFCYHRNRAFKRSDRHHKSTFFSSSIMDADDVEQFLFMLSLIDNIVLSHVHAFDTRHSAEGSRVYTLPHRKLRRVRSNPRTVRQGAQMFPKTLGSIRTRV